MLSLGGALSLPNKVLKTRVKPERPEASKFLQASHIPSDTGSFHILKALRGLRTPSLLY